MHCKTDLNRYCVGIGSMTSKAGRFPYLKEATGLELSWV